VLSSVDIYKTKIDY